MSYKNGSVDEMGVNKMGVDEIRRHVLPPLGCTVSEILPN